MKQGARWILMLMLAAGASPTQSPVQMAPAKVAARKNPFERNETARRAGAKLFARECAACHGAAGEGSGKAAALKSPEVSQAPPGALFWVLENGSLGGGMPSFAHLPEPQRWQIVTFLESLNARPKD